MIAPSLTHTSQLLVTAADTATAAGSGDMPVLATPRMIALMENAAMLAVADELDEGLSTVGGEMNVRHLAPTPVGATVEASALLVSVEGKRLTFHVTARQGDKLIGEGTHTRFIVNRLTFLSKLQ